MRCAAFNTGPDFHLLDHIAPLAAGLQMPLFVTDEKNFELAKTYYPQGDVQWMPDIDLGCLAQHFDALFECKYWAPHLKQLFRDLFHKEIKLVFCAHGQSDKGYAAPLLAPYAHHDLALLYGPLMERMLGELGIEASTLATGNYRLAHYLRHQTFYDACAEREVFVRLPRNRTLLYAPTWNDADGATSFFEWAPKVVKALPPHWNLLVKVHPLLEQRNPAQYYRIATLLEKAPRTHLISDFPPVYPILSRADAYLGDASSVGYDYLYFRRPMFFFQSHGRLTTCGTVVEDVEGLSELLDRPHLLAGKQGELYRAAFGKTPHDAQGVREALLSRLREAK